MVLVRFDADGLPGGEGFPVDFVVASTAEPQRLVEAAGAHEYDRLPEMFCGFTRRSINKPVAFPMACSPDAPPRCPPGRLPAGRVVL